VPLVAEQDRRIVGVLPLVRLDRGPLGRALISLPYFGHGGAVAASPEAWSALVARCREVAHEQGAAHVELRHAHPLPPHSLPSRDDKVLMHLALPPTIEALDKQLGSKIRSDVRRPQKEGMTTEVGGRALVCAFHEVYAAVMRDLGSPCHSLALFEEILACFHDRAFVVRVLYQGRTVGAAFLVGQGDVLEVPCAGTLHALNKLRPNMLLYWAVLCEAIRRGYKTFSFGRSTVNAGTYTFKKNWGAVPIALPYHYVLANGTAIPQAHGERAILQKASALWSRLPLPLTTVLGPYVVRHLP
jgi:FemAB-related protein (PEP-CTERM system-associated)